MGEQQLNKDLSLDKLISEHKLMKMYMEQRGFDRQTRYQLQFQAPKVIDLSYLDEDDPNDDNTKTQISFSEVKQSRNLQTNQPQMLKVQTTSQSDFELDDQEDAVSAIQLSTQAHQQNHRYAAPRTLLSSTSVNQH